MSTNIAKLSNADLLARLRETWRANGRLLAVFIRLLIGAEERRLYLEKAYPSLFELCQKEFGLSEGEAYRRINAAKLVARFPQLLPYIERGDIHLTALSQLRDHFTQSNIDDLVASTKGKNKMQIAEIVARLSPRPDVPAKLRKVPHHDNASRMSKESRPSLDPLSEARYRLQMTGSRDFRDKLFRARDLMMHTNPSGDLAVVVERAIDELLEVLEKRVFGKLSRKPKQLSSAPATLTEVAPLTSSAPPSDESSTRKKARDGARRPGLARASSAPNEKRRESPTRTRDVPVSSRRTSVDLRRRKSRYENGQAPARKGAGGVARSASARC